MVAANIPAYQIPLPLFDATAAWMLAVLESMVYDDALTRARWRVEYLHLESGLPHYRVYRGQSLFGMVDVRYPTQLPIVRLKLALFLSAQGFAPHNAQVLHHGRRTAYTASKKGRRITLAAISYEQDELIRRSRSMMKREAHLMQETSYSYIARKDCGCIYGAIAEQHRNRVPVLAQWAAEGATIERVADEVVRREFQGWHCQHEKAKRAAPPVIQLPLFKED